LLRAANEVSSPRVDCCLEHLGVDERRVGGSQSIDQVLRDEAQLVVILPVELGITDDRVD
jgi:hypothetical protein